MAAIELPFVPSLANYRVGTTIEGTSYLFDVRYNSRTKAFYLDIRELSAKLIVAGVKVVLGAYLGRRSNHKLFRSGVLVAVDLTDRQREATLDDFGVRVVIEYIPILDLMVRLEPV